MLPARHRARLVLQRLECETWRDVGTSMIETVRRIGRNVKRRQSGDMGLRWTAGGMLEAETQFPGPL